MTPLLIGIDIGGTKSAVVLGDADGNVHAREQIPTRGPTETIGRLIGLAKTLRHDRPASACGISCGGPLSSRDGLVLSPPNLPGWDRVPIVRLFNDALDAPTALENDANASAVAEWQWGFGRSVDDLVYLTCGTGQGAGLILGGRLHRGRQDLAGEVGHIRLAADGPFAYGKAGSAEALTSGSGLGKLAARRLAGSNVSSTLRGMPPDLLDGKAVGEAAAAGDALARSVLAEAADYLGQLCAILIDVLNPTHISLGSLANRLGSPFIDAVRSAAQRESLPGAFDDCTIDRSRLGDRVQDLAALAVAKHAAGL